MNKYVVYTAICGQYDDLPVIHDYASIGGVDFVCFSDHDLKVSPPWRLVKIDLIDNDPMLTNRHIKFCSHKYLHGYVASIYMDGNLDIGPGAVKILEELSSSSSCVFIQHPDRSSALEEVVACIFYKNISVMDSIKLVLRQSISGYRDNLQLTANRYFARYYDSELNDFFDAVFHEFCRGPKRDQLHLQYMLWCSNVGHKVVEKKWAGEYIDIRPHNDQEKFLIRLFRKVNTILFNAPLLYFFVAIRNIGYFVLRNMK